MSDNNDANAMMIHQVLERIAFALEDLAALERTRLQEAAAEAAIAGEGEGDG